MRAVQAKPNRLVAMNTVAAPHPSHTPATMLVVLDCDSTLIEQEVIELIADAAGTRELVAEVTERAMRGELDFAESLIARVATLKGVGYRVFTDVLNSITVTRGVPELISHVHAVGGVVGVVSGGFHEVLDPLALRLGINEWAANRLEVRDGSLTGLTQGAIVDGNTKAQKLQQWAEAYGVPQSHTVAIGDGANDIPMMAVAGLSVAFNAKPKVREFATLQVEDDLSKVIAHLPEVTA